ILSNRNCFKLLVKMIAASPIARCPSFKFLTMQMQPSASRVRNCGPFCPRPPCTQTSRTASDDLASSYRTRGWATGARRGLKEAYSKRAGRWTNIGYKAQASDERATYREVHIHQGCEA